MKKIFLLSPLFLISSINATIAQVPVDPTSFVAQIILVATKIVINIITFGWL